MLLMISHANTLPDRNLLSQCQAIVLFQDGVYLQSQLSLPTACPCYVLAEDAQARAVAISSNHLAISYEQWVTLTLQHQPVVQF